MQSQQKRAEFPLKFNRVISHIVHSLAPNISDDKKMHRVLKSIEMTKPDLDEDQVRKELATDENEQKDFLIEALSIGSKPFNNYESGYVPNISEKSDLNAIVDQYPWDSIKKTDRETSSSSDDKAQFDKIRELLKFSNKEQASNKNFERFSEKDFDSSRQRSKKSIQNSTKYVDDHNNIKEFMSMHSQKLIGLLSEKRKKREQKEIEKLITQKEAVYDDSIHNPEFNNDMFDNIKINKKPSKDSLIVTLNSDVMHENQYLNDNKNGNHQSKLNGYSHNDDRDSRTKKNGYENHSNNCHQSYQQSYAELRSEPYVTSNHN
jgi:hypothetical protein